VTGAEHTAGAASKAAPAGWSRRQAWRWGASRLRETKAFTGDAVMESEVLLRAAAAISREEFFARPDAPLPPAAAAGYRALVVRRAAGVPTAYVVGHREFFGLDLAIDARVLIPRPETECLVEAVVDALLCRRDPLVVDVGTGSGAIAIALARALPGARLLATDVSCAALDVARKNAERCGVADRISWFAGPGLDPLRRCEAEGRVDALACNPPYIPSAAVATLAEEVREWEPRIALDGGPDGLDLHRAVAGGAAFYLAPGGVLAMEVAALWDQARTVGGLIAATGAFGPARVIRDHADAERVVVAERISGRGDRRG
jgi:release factor glutamine methyltransferase